VNRIGSIIGKDSNLVWRQQLESGKPAARTVVQKIA